MFPSYMSLQFHLGAEHVVLKVAILRYGVEQGLKLEFEYTSDEVRVIQCQSLAKGGLRS